MAEVAKKKKAVKKKKTAKKKMAGKKTASKVSPQKEKALRKMAELADSIGLSSVRMESKMNFDNANIKEEVVRERRKYVKHDSSEVSTSSLSAADKAVLDEHKRLYEMLASCADVDEFSRIYKRYAELDVKVARITNRDTNAIERCMYENSYGIVK